MPDFTRSTVVGLFGDFLPLTGGTLSGNLAINRAANVTSALFIGEPAVLRGDAQESQIVLLGEDAGVIASAIFTYTGANLELNGTGFLQLGMDGLDILAGGILRVRDATDADSASWTHDGTDFNLALTNTSDYNIVGISRFILGSAGIFAGGATLTGALTLNMASPSISFQQGGTDRAKIQVLGVGVDGGHLRMFSRPDGGVITEVLRLASNNIVTVFQGARLQVQDATGADYALWSHDGIDFNLALVNTTDYNITGLTNLRLDGALVVQIGGAADAGGGSGLRISAPVNGATDVEMARWRILGGSNNPVLLVTLNEDNNKVTLNASATLTPGLSCIFQLGGSPEMELFFTGLAITNGLGLHGTAPSAVKPTVAGSRGGNAALASLLTALVGYGFIIDSTTA